MYYYNSLSLLILVSSCDTGSSLTSHLESSFRMPSVATIHKRHVYGKDAHTYYPVLIVGAGESGVAMGCRLKEVLGTDQFRIFERQSGIGGTWWINRYPGAACDMYVSEL